MVQAASIMCAHLSVDPPMLLHTVKLVLPLPLPAVAICEIAWSLLIVSCIILHMVQGLHQRALPAQPRCCLPVVRHAATQ